MGVFKDLSNQPKIIARGLKVIVSNYPTSQHLFRKIRSKGKLQSGHLPDQAVNYRYHLAEVTIAMS
jgi:hypothetical protein